MESFGPGNEDIMTTGFDNINNVRLHLIQCPGEAIGSTGPVFEHMDDENIYILISKEFVEGVTASSESREDQLVKYGMLMGDIMRRGIYYSQNFNNKKNKLKNKEEM